MRRLPLFLLLTVSLETRGGGYICCTVSSVARIAMTDQVIWSADQPFPLEKAQVIVRGRNNNIKPRSMILDHMMTAPFLHSQSFANPSKLGDAGTMSVAGLWVICIFIHRVFTTGDRTTRLKRVPHDKIHTVSLRCKWSFPLLFADMCSRSFS